MSPKALSQRLRSVTIPEEPAIQAEFTCDDITLENVGVGYQKRGPAFLMPKPLNGDEHACSCAGSFSLGAGSETVEKHAQLAHRCTMSPRACSPRLEGVNIPYDPEVQAEWTNDDLIHEPYAEWTYGNFFRDSASVGYSRQNRAFTMLQPSGGDETSCAGYTSGSDCGSPSSRQASRSFNGASWQAWQEWVEGKARDSSGHLVFRSVDVSGYRTRAPNFTMPQTPVGDESDLPMTPQGSRSSTSHFAIHHEQDAVRAVLRRVYTVAALSFVEAPAPCVHSHPRRVSGWPSNDDVRHSSLHTPLAVVPEEELTSADELSGVGGVVAEKYYLSVQLGDRIPMETGAARVNSSRLETGPEWRDFLRHSVECDLNDGLSLDTMLQCPCCLGILRRPVGLPCGHSFCRGCLMRLMPSAEGDATAAAVKRCPLCRAAIPHMRMHVNEPLDAVSEALHVYLTLRKRSREGVATPSLDSPLQGAPSLIGPSRTPSPPPFVHIALPPEPLLAPSALPGDVMSDDDDLAEVPRIRPTLGSGSR